MLAFFAGCASLVITSSLIAGIFDEEAIGCALISLVLGMFFVLLGVAFWAIVRRPKTVRRARQFSLVSLLMTTALVAAFSAMVGGLTDLHHETGSHWSVLLQSALGLAMFGLAGVLPWLFWINSLSWFVVWLAKSGKRPPKAGGRPNEAR